MPEKLTVMRRLGQFLLLALLFGLAPVAHASEKLVVPFEQDEYDRLIVELTFSDKVTRRGVVDSAATMPLISEPTARAVGVAEVPPGTERFVTILGLGGPEVFPLRDIPRLSAGNVGLRDVPVALDKRIAVDGVLNVFPASILDGDVLDFDFDKGYLSAYDSRPAGPNRNILSRQPLRIRDGLFFIDVEINGVKGQALIDTGSSITYMNSRFAEASNTRTNERKTEELLGITGEDFDVRMARVSRLEVGKLNLARLDLLVSDPLLFEYLGLSDEPVMVLGMDFITNFRMQIDRKNKRVYFRSREGTQKNCLICSDILNRASRLD